MRFERWFYTVPLWLRSLFRRGRLEEELDEEFRIRPADPLTIGAATLLMIAVAA